MKRIKKGDKIRVICGNNMGQEGIVLSINTKDQTAIIEGVNVRKKHTKPSAQTQDEGGIKTKEVGIQLSNLALVAPKSATGVSKIKYATNKEGKKVRIAKKTNLEIGQKK